MALGLQGKVTLVTASSEGLGLACAERFAVEGCSVALCGRRVDVLENARAKLASYLKTVSRTGWDWLCYYSSCSIVWRRSW